MAQKVDKSIHDRTGEFTTSYTMKEIEKALHPRSRETVTEELEDLVDKFAKDHKDSSGTIKNAETAADAFLDLVGQYHFGTTYDAIGGEDNRRHVAKILREEYGLSREALVTAFSRKGAYKGKRAIFEQHVDPIVNTIDEKKRETAQQSLSEYLTDGQTRSQVEAHIESRTDRKLSQDNYLNLQDAFSTIAAYMAQPGSEDAIDKMNAKLRLPDSVAGQPGLNHVFEGGDLLHEKYQETPRKVDDMHKIKGHKKPEYAHK